LRNWIIAAAIVLTVPRLALAQELPCAILTSPITANVIGLPTRDARITSAVLVAASPESADPNGTVSPAVPEYCRVVGSIAPVDPTAPDILFQVNLPTAWNGKAVQYGGGGFNGTLVTGLSPLNQAPPDVAAPLSHGFATFGTDSGHQAAALPEIQAFALNDEALMNFAYASYKKTRDVAVELVKRRFGRPPSRTYYFGTSEGGREGLTMAQRFPADYDGVVSMVPVINWVALQHAGHRSGVAQQNGGWLNPRKVSLLQQAVLNACDALDSLPDGIVSNFEACGSKFDGARLRCPDGADTGDSCLSDPQIAAVALVRAPYTFTFPLANGVTTYPGYGVGGEAQPGGFSQWVTAARPAAFPSPAASGQGLAWQYGNGAIRHFIVGNALTDPFSYSPDAHRERVRQVSELMDSTNPDLSEFHRRGGKLILKEHMADYAQSPFAGIEYYKAVVTTMGQATVDQFVRLYVTPGANHGGNGVSGTSGQAIPQYIDLLGVLDAWVDRKQPPAEPLVQTGQAARPPHTVSASRPMCRYPAFPRYKGAGDPNLASSFACSTSGQVQ
jgi:feruloyl esterase